MVLFRVLEIFFLIWAGGVLAILLMEAALRRIKETPEERAARQAYEAERNTAAIRRERWLSGESDDHS